MALNGITKRTYTIENACISHIFTFLNNLFLSKKNFILYVKQFDAKTSSHMIMFISFSTSVGAGQAWTK